MTLIPHILADWFLFTMDITLLWLCWRTREKQSQALLRERYPEVAAMLDERIVG